MLDESDLVAIEFAHSSEHVFRAVHVTEIINSFLHLFNRLAFAISVNFYLLLRHQLQNTESFLTVIGPMIDYYQRI